MSYIIKSCDEVLSLIDARMGIILRKIKTLEEMVGADVQRIAESRFKSKRNRTFLGRNHKSFEEILRDQEYSYMNYDPYGIQKYHNDIADLDKLRTLAKLSSDGIIYISSEDVVKILDLSSETPNISGG